MDFHDEASQREKCYTTLGPLPAFVDPKQPPGKRSPFSAILGHPFVHTTELILPEEIHRVVWSSIESKIKGLRYARVIMPLSALLEGDFFNTYIRTGDVLLISEGRSGVDDVFSLHNGILRLELGKESFERTGLTGKPIRGGGRKHAKERYLVEINLRLPSMLHGKKGFERIVWAFKNALTDSVTWLFYDLAPEPSYTDPDKPLRVHHPQVVDCAPVQVTHRDALTPPLNARDLREATSEDDVQAYCNELSEWLALVSLDSPRVSADDDVDPYLSRYVVPCVDDAKPSALVSVKWHGLIPSQWIMQLFIVLLREISPRTAGPHAWFALSSHALGRDAVDGKDGYTILSLPSAGSENGEQGKAPDAAEETERSEEGKRERHHRRFICWEFVGAALSYS
ncbi:hypothetical protein VTN02DRAFT_1497 [Thermoascus thermophilus]